MGIDEAIGDLEQVVTPIVVRFAERQAPFVDRPSLRASGSKAGMPAKVAEKFTTAKPRHDAAITLETPDAIISFPRCKKCGRTSTPPLNVI